MSAGTGSEGAGQYSSEFVGRRYDRLASVYGLLEAVYMMRGGIRRATVDSLRLGPGGTVLEIGCGTGSNLPLLVERVGPTGRVIGIDVSPGMVAKAERLRRRSGWKNVELAVRDAAEFEPPESLDGVLFSLSYSVLSEQRRVLGRAWDRLAAGGRLAIMDAGAPDGRAGRLLGSPMRVLSRATVLGNPDARAEAHLAELAADVECRRFWPGAYFLCVAAK